MQKPIFGKFISGICKGISSRQITNRTTGEVSNIIEVGLASFRNDNFGDVVEVVEMIQLSKTLVAAGAPAKLANLKGKHVMLSYWPNAYKSASAKNGAALTNYLSNDWEAHLVTFQPELSKAV